MKPLLIKDPADRFDLSYVFANDFPALGKKLHALHEMAEVARAIVPGVCCRAALVHPGEIDLLMPLLKGSSVRPEVVIDFPDGAGGVETKHAQAEAAARAGAVGGDVVLNLRQVAIRDETSIRAELSAAVSALKEIKVIAQVPYLWQYDKEAVTWLLELLPKEDVYCIKDWTTRVDNFLLPDGEILDYTHESRLAYLRYMRDYIAAHSLPLILKVAGRVTPDNVCSFVDAGAVLIGTSYRKAPALRDTLMSA